MNQRAVGVLGAFVIALSFVSCGGGGATTPTTPAATAPTLTGISVVGPTSPARPAESAQFTANASFSNGTNQNVSSQATWQSSNTAVATASSGGMVRAVAPGAADIRATHQGASGSVGFTVVSLLVDVCGNVREVPGNSAIRGARMDVTEGADAGRRTETDNGGNYCLTGLQPGTFEIRAWKADYDELEQRVTADTSTTLNFSLRKSSAAPPAPAPNPTPGPPSAPTPTCGGAPIPASARCINNGTPPVTAVCKDGAFSCSQNRQGTCSSHGGVQCWVCPGKLCSGLTAPVSVAAPAWPELPSTPVPLGGSSRQ